MAAGAADVEVPAAASVADRPTTQNAREAALNIRKGTDTTAEVKALRDDLEKLRDENRALRDRVTKVEAGKPGG